MLQFGHRGEILIKYRVAVSKFYQICPSPFFEKLVHKACTISQDVMEWVSHPAHRSNSVAIIESGTCQGPTYPLSFSLRQNWRPFHPREESHLWISLLACNEYPFWFLLRNIMYILNIKYLKWQEEIENWELKNTLSMNILLLGGSVQCSCVESDDTISKILVIGVWAYHEFHPGISRYEAVIEQVWCGYK